MNVEEVMTQIDKDFGVSADREPKQTMENTQPTQVEIPPMVSPQTDIYQRRLNERMDESKKRFPAGSSQRVLAIIEDAVNGDGGRPGLAREYRRVKDDSDSLKEQGWKSRAKMLQQQYMEEKFLPIVEVVVNFTSPDELLNNSRALKTLDKYVMSAGSGSGFTESYVRTAYANQLGARPGLSDATIAEAVRRIKAMASNDNIRGAYAMAKKMLRKIDRGEAMASDDDYTLITRVASFK